MKPNTLWKRVGSILLVFVLIVSLITITESRTADASPKAQTVYSENFTSGRVLKAQTSAGTASIEEDSTGNKYMKATINGQGSFYSDSIMVMQGQTYTFSYRVKVMNVTPAASGSDTGVYLRPYYQEYYIMNVDGNKAGGYNQSYPSQGLTQTGEWQTVSVTYTPTVGMNYVQFFINNAHNGTVEFLLDDISLTYVPSETNQIANGTFDTPTDKNNINPTGWYKKGDDNKPQAVSAQTSVPVMEKKYIVNEDFADDQSSTTYTKRINTNTNITLENGMIQVAGDKGGIRFDNIPVTGGKTYTIFYRIKFAIEGINTDVSAETYEKYSVAYIGSTFKTTQTQDGWIEAEATYTIPEGKTSLYLMIYHDNTNTNAGFYLDDFQIYSTEQRVEESCILRYDSKGFDDSNMVFDNWSQSNIVSGVGVDNSNAQVTKAGKDNYVAYQSNISTTYLLEKGKTYRVSMDTKVDENSTYVIFETAGSTWNATEGFKNTSYETKTIFVTPVETKEWQQIGIQVASGTGKAYMDNFKIEEVETKNVSTFTEGIGLSDGTDNSLAMEEMSEVYYPVSVTAEKEYYYSYTAKAVDGADCTVAAKVGSQTIKTSDTLTTEETTVSGTFTATDNANCFSLVKSGTGKVVIDDVVLCEKLPTNATNHTNLPDGGHNMPQYAVNLISNGDLETNFDGYVLAGNCKRENGMMILRGSNTENASLFYVPTATVTANHTYTFSYYVWISDASNLLFDMFSEGGENKPATGPSGSGGWCDNGLTQWSCKLDGEEIKSSLSENTYGWRKVEITWTAKESGNIRFGLKIYQGQGTIYVDDLAMWDTAIQNPTFTDITTKISVFDYWPGLENYLHLTPLREGTVYGNAKKETTLMGTVYINGISHETSYQWSNETILLNFNSNALGTYLSQNQENEVWIKAGTELLAPDLQGLKITEDIKVYLQQVNGVWLAWGSRHEYDKNSNANVQYQDMGAGVHVYTFTNNATQTYQGVTAVTGPKNIAMKDWYKEDESQLTYRETTNLLGDYSVMSTENYVLFDYTVVLYKRGNAHLGADLRVDEAVIDSKDLIAVKKAAKDDLAGDNVLSRMKAADADADGKVDENDAVILRRAIANSIDIMATTKGESTLGQGVMPILGYDGPDNNNTYRAELGGKKDMITDDIYEKIAELGINTVIINTDYCDSLEDWKSMATPTLKYASKYGMKAYLSDGTIINRNTEDESQNFVGKVDADVIAKRSSLYDVFGSFAGYFLTDEPLYKSAGLITGIVDKDLKDRPTIDEYAKPFAALSEYANISSYMNFYPAHSSSLISTSGGSGKEYYRMYIGTAAKLHADALPYDMYLRPNGTGDDYSLSTEHFYQNLSWMRDVAIENNKPFQTFVQVGTDFVSEYNKKTKQENLTTRQEMFLEASASLAMGAKGINYFSLIAPTYFVDNSSEKTVVDNYRVGLINIYGEKNCGAGGDNYNYFEAAKKINTFIAKVDHILMSCDSKGVVTTDPTIKNYLGDAAIDVTKTDSLSSVSGTGAFVGCFSYFGKDVYMLVNTSTKKSTDITLTMKQKVAYDSYSMDGAETSEEDSTMTYTVPAGECVLVVTK